MSAETQTRLSRQNEAPTEALTAAPVSFRERLFAATEATADLARRFELFCRYGNFTMAYATLQPGMKYFEAHGGYLAYDTCWGVTFVLGDPVAPAGNHAAIIEA